MMHDEKGAPGFLQQGRGDKRCSSALHLYFLWGVWYNRRRSILDDETRDSFYRCLPASVRPKRGRLSAA